MQLGRSTEDIQHKVSSSEDEFENSVDEILEREGALESDREITDQEVSDFSYFGTGEGERTWEAERTAILGRAMTEVPGERELVLGRESYSTGEREL